MDRLRERKAGVFALQIEASESFHLTVLPFIVH